MYSRLPAGTTLLAKCFQRSSLKGKNPGWVYVLDSQIEAYADKDHGVYKIGRAQNLTPRIKQLRTAYAYKLHIAYAFETGDCVKDERLLHQRFASQNTNGEWFRLTLEDLGEISAFADYCGVFEMPDGRMVTDPFMPFDLQESRSIRLAVAELENNRTFAVESKYFPLEPTLDLPLDILEAEADTHLSERGESEADQYEDYLEYCREEEEAQEYLLRQQEEAEEKEDEDWNHEYLEEGDEELVEAIEDIRTGRDRVAYFNIAVTEMEAYGSQA